MKKWITNVIQSATVNAVDKAKTDIVRISNQNGYKTLNIFRYYSGNESDEAMHARIDGITAAVAPGDYVVYQYPTYVGIRFDIFFLMHLAARNAKIILFIHDVETLRHGKDESFDEIGLLNKCSALVVHTKAMSTELQVMGVKVPMIVNYTFDYLPSKNIQNEVGIQKKVVIAGSLAKSSFLKQWNYETNIDVFGRLPADALSENVNYRGEFSQEELMEKLPHCFGLAWDTAKDFGQYTRYNNPHKVAMYLSMGLPVIIWKEAGMAQFITDNKLGYSLESLDDLDGLMNTLDAKSMDSVVNQVRKFSLLLREGFFTTRALLEAERVALFGNVVFG